jgi:SAM-dependent methyltransferase
MSGQIWYAGGGIDFKRPGQAWNSMSAPKDSALADDARTRESQYQVFVEDVRTLGWERMGLITSHIWRNDPKHVVFSLSRYKFVSKMFAGRRHVLEVGCGDALATRIVRQTVNALTATDFDPVFIEDARARMSPPWTYELAVHDFTRAPMPCVFDAVFALDVLEHIQPDAERGFLSNVFASLEREGAAIIGMPSLESQVYASEVSRLGHVNCKSAPDLQALMSAYFYNVFMFSMNDEVVHTGFHKMAHYILAVGCGKRT